jgi:chemotaxis response regulator CheB
MRKMMKMSIKAGTPLKDFPIVCVGGSAGGLDAYIRLLQNLPADMGVAIVIVNHITEMPTHLP